jgi:peptide/nickel transport system ATP-binding protein
VELGLALLFISHDQGVVASVADRVLVLERGIIREQGEAAGVLTCPSDPYTKTLVDAISRLPATGAAAGNRVVQP